MTPKRWTQRHRRVVRYVAFSVLALGACVALVVLKDRRTAHTVIPGQSVEGLTNILARKVPAGAARVQFPDVTADLGIEFVHLGGGRSRFLPEDVGSGCALEDLDGDGDLDLFLVNFEPIVPAKKHPNARTGHALYLNDGTGRFREVSRAAGVDTPVHGLGVSAGDPDADGDVDLFVTCFGDPDQLFLNRGDATFQDVAPVAGLVSPGFHLGATFADYDGDEDVDLYVGGYVYCRFEPELTDRVDSQYGLAIPFTLNPSSYRPERNILWRNRGNGTFENATDEAGVANPEGRTMAVAFTDLDGDHLPDIYTANDVSDNAYYRNRGDGTFEDLSYPTRTSDYRGAMGLAIGDYDGDLDPDIFVTHWIAQENSLFERMELEGLRHPIYADVADERGLGAVSLDWVGWGTFFFDYDADGRQDLFVANGSTLENVDDTSELVPQRIALFWNGDDLGFFNVAVELPSNFSRPGNYRGAVAGDIDGDGDQDIVVTSSGGQPRVLRNSAPPDHGWLIVKVRSHGANRLAVGAEVLVEAGDLRIRRIVGAQPSYLSSMPLELHFGLGKRTRADRVTVRFASGRVVVLDALDVNRRILVEEP